MKENTSLKTEQSSGDKPHSKGIDWMMELWGNEVSITFHTFCNEHRFCMEDGIIDKTMTLKEWFQ